MIENMTYNDLFNTVVDTICAKCVNVANNGSGIPAEMKAGYRNVITFSPGTDYPKYVIVTLKSDIANNYINVKSKSFVQNCLDTYLTKIGTFEGMITPNGIITYMDAITRFVSRNVIFYSCFLLSGPNPGDEIRRCVPVFDLKWGTSGTKKELDPPIIKHNYPHISCSINQLFWDLFNETCDPRKRCKTLKYDYKYTDKK